MDGGMNKMTLPSRHMTLYSSPGLQTKYFHFFAMSHISHSKAVFQLRIERFKTIIAVRRPSPLHMLQRGDRI